MLDNLINSFSSQHDKVAVVFGPYEVTYSQLIADIESRYLSIKHKVLPGMVVVIQGDFTPTTIALLIALLKHNTIVVPVSREAEPHELSHVLAISQAALVFNIETDERVVEKDIPNVAKHPLYAELSRNNEPGMVCFTSGSSGVPKGTLHAVNRLLTRYKKSRPNKIMLNFLLFDHLGGLNTMFHILSSGGTLVGLQNRSQDYVCSIMEKYRVQVLPTSPTFLNMLLLSGLHEKYDLSHLELITYGAEPMPESTLLKLNDIFPKASFLQTYGLIEVGSISTRSRAGNSLWIKLGVKGEQWRVVDGILQIKTTATMLGYLNAPSPFTEDGWFITGDRVEEDGEYLKILGRASEMINVGGEKVFPVEIENVIMSMDDVEEVTVFSSPHPIMGKMICASVRLKLNEAPTDFKKKLKKYCYGRLAPFKVPSKIYLSAEKHFSPRMKKDRFNVMNRAKSS